MSDLREAAKLVLIKLAESAERLRAKERAEIESAASNHTSMPHNYWESRHKADRLVAAARGFYDALREAEGDA